MDFCATRVDCADLQCKEYAITLILLLLFSETRKKERNIAKKSLKGKLFLIVSCILFEKFTSFRLINEQNNS